MNYRNLLLLIIVSLLLGCNKQPAIQDSMLDGDTIFDPSLYEPEKKLLSKEKPNPTPVELNTPVVIVCHGYTATTFEWDEFRQWQGNRTDFFISQVLLGGHGRNYETFKNSTWKDWQAAIAEEYEQLVNLGYTKISLAGSSTGGALILKMIHDGYFDNRQAPEEIFLVDPIVIPSDKNLSIIGVVGPMLGYVEVDQTSEEDKYWYHFRPYETLKELNKITRSLRKDLQKGFTLPQGCSLKVYKAEKDGSADPVSAVLIYKGVKTHNGKPVDVQMIDSDLHVFTRLDLRPSVSAKDSDNREMAFTDMVDRMLK